MVLVALLGAATMYLRPLYLASCDVCDQRLLRESMDFYFFAAPIVTVAALLGVVLLRGRGRRVIIPAAVGLALVIGLFAASFIASEIALFG